MAGCRPKEALESKRSMANWPTLPMDTEGCAGVKE